MHRIDQLPRQGLAAEQRQQRIAEIASGRIDGLADVPLCQEMLKILRNQQDRCDIPRYLEFVDSSETPSAIGNKTGALDDVRNDVGLVTTMAGDIIISAFTWDNRDQRWMTLGLRARVFHWCAC